MKLTSLKARVCGPARAADWIAALVALVAVAVALPANAQQPAPGPPGMPPDPAPPPAAADDDDDNDNDDREPYEVAPGIGLGGRTAAADGDDDDREGTDAQVPVAPPLEATRPADDEDFLAKAEYLAAEFTLAMYGESPDAAFNLFAYPMVAVGQIAASEEDVTANFREMMQMLAGGMVQMLGGAMDDGGGRTDRTLADVDVDVMPFRFGDLAIGNPELLGWMRKHFSESEDFIAQLPEDNILGMWFGLTRVIIDRDGADLRIRGIIE